jgi:hypothetical protein
MAIFHVLPYTRRAARPRWARENAAYSITSSARASSNVHHVDAGHYLE